MTLFHIFRASLIASGFCTLAVAGALAKDTLLEESQRFINSINVGNFSHGGEKSRYAWLNTEQFFLQSTIQAGENSVSIENAPKPSVAAYVVNTPKGEMALSQYVEGIRGERDLIDGVVILHEGKVVYEAYPNMASDDRHLAWSVSKVAVSTVLAILEADGLIDFGNTVGDYLTEFQSTVWADISLADVADMASGVKCREVLHDSFTNPEHCIFQYFGTLFNQDVPKAAMPRAVDVLSQVPKETDPGEAYAYSSANTFVLSKVIETVTGMAYWEALEKFLWQPMGAEADALLLVNKYGEADAGGGISAKLRDIARMGLIYTASSPRSLLPDGYTQGLVNKARPYLMERSPDGLYLGASPPYRPVSNARQWDKFWEDGDLYKNGFSGQGLYISPQRDLVMAWFGTHRLNGRAHKLPDIARQLALSPLFDSE